MSYSVEKISGNQVKIDFHVEAEKFDEALQKAYLKMRGRINVPGFRRGKAPRKLIEKMYGENVFYEEAIDLIFPDAYSEAVDGEKLKVVDQPVMEKLDQVGQGKELIFSVKVYVSPDVELGEYRGLEAVKYLHKVTDEEVDREMESDIRKETTTVDVTDRALENGDTAKLDYAGTVDGVAFEGGTAKDQTLKIGSNSFIPGFEDQMIGMQIGEEKDLNVTFPEKYHSEELAGKQAVFHVKLNGIQAEVKPELDDEFAQDVSEFNTFEEYKANLRKKLEDAAQKRADAETENELIQKAVDAADCDIPDAMVNGTLDNMMRDYELRMSYQGLKLSDFLKYTGQTEEQLRENYRSQAFNQTKTRIVLEEIAKKEAVEPTDEDIEKAIAEDAERFGRDKEEYRKQMSDRQLEFYRDDLRLRKTVDLIVENAKIEEKDEEERVTLDDAKKAVEAVEQAADEEEAGEEKKED